jgi:hypothetical protein
MDWFSLTCIQAQISSPSLWSGTPTTYKYAYLYIKINQDKSLYCTPTLIHVKESLMKLPRTSLLPVFLTANQKLQLANIYEEYIIAKITCHELVSDRKIVKYSCHK